MSDNRQTDREDWEKIGLGLILFCVGTLLVNWGYLGGFIGIALGLFSISLGSYGLRNAERLRAKGLKK